MSRGNALGFIESVGLASAIAAADAALKAANVELIGRENTRGFGYITIKITGEVGAVQAAISAAKASSSKVARVWSTDIIPRPAKDLGKLLVWNKNTQGADDWFIARGLDAGTPPPEAKENKQLANRPRAELVPVAETEKPESAPEAEQAAPAQAAEKPEPSVRKPKTPPAPKSPGRRRKKTK